MTIQSYRVLNHMKTVVIMIGGAMLFDDSCTRLQILGSTCALLGLMLYTLSQSKEQATISDKAGKAS